MKDMTNSQLEAAARQYDNINNEGGDGYNPYREEMARRDFAAAKAMPRTEYDILRDLETLAGTDPARSRKGRRNEDHR